ncbi:MAG: ATP-binding cassette domain-containing protein, partial [Anaerolineaceae bacterium]|nr:ATP-binding cassette domain-containing protein [Anaerolineaceae bacterium]
MSAPIRIENVTKTFGSVRAVDNVSLATEPGELYFLLGPSGCGKTTLLRAVAGLAEIDSGDIYLGRHRIIHGLR